MLIYVITLYTNAGTYKNIGIYLQVLRIVGPFTRAHLFIFYKMSHYAYFNFFFFMTAWVIIKSSLVSAQVNIARLLEDKYMCIWFG